MSQQSDQQSYSDNLQKAFDDIIAASRLVKQQAENIGEGSYWRFQESSLIAGTREVLAKVDKYMLLAKDADKLNKEAHTARGQQLALLKSTQDHADRSAMAPPHVVDPEIAQLREENRQLLDERKELIVHHKQLEIERSNDAQRAEAAEQRARDLTRQLQQLQTTHSPLDQSNPTFPMAQSQPARRLAPAAFDVDVEARPAKKISLGDKTPTASVSPSTRPERTVSPRKTSGSESESSSVPKKRFSTIQSFASMLAPPVEDCPPELWASFSNQYEHYLGRTEVVKQATMLETVARLEGRGCVLARAQKVVPARAGDPAFTDRAKCGYTIKNLKHICVYLTKLDLAYQNEDDHEVKYQAHCRGASS